MSDEEGSAILARGRRAVADAADAFRRLKTAANDLDKGGWADELFVLFDATFPGTVSEGVLGLDHYLDLFSKWDQNLTDEGILDPGGEDWMPRRTP